MRHRNCHYIDVKKYTVIPKLFMIGVKSSGGSEFSANLNSSGVTIFKPVDSLISRIFHKQ